jgi:hypothetical protein
VAIEVVAEDSVEETVEAEGVASEVAEVAAVEVMTRAPLSTYKCVLSSLTLAKVWPFATALERRCPFS